LVVFRRRKELCHGPLSEAGSMRPRLLTYTERRYVSIGRLSALRLGGEEPAEDGEVVEDERPADLPGPSAVGVRERVRVPHRRRRRTRTLGAIEFHATPLRSKSQRQGPGRKVGER
jgi:hypothetical protein